MVLGTIGRKVAPACGTLHFMTSDPLLSLVDEERTEAIHRQREREHRLKQQAQEQASLLGTLLDLAEQQETVSIRTESGNTHCGIIQTIGRDFIAMTMRGDVNVYCTLSAIATVRPQTNALHGPAYGDREPSLDLLFIEFLATAAEGHPWVTITSTGREQVSGRLSAVGVDVVTIQLEGDRPSVCYVSSAAVAEAILRSAIR